MKPAWEYPGTGSISANSALFVGFAVGKHVGLLSLRPPGFGWRLLARGGLDVPVDRGNTCASHPASRTVGNRAKPATAIARRSTTSPVRRVGEQSEHVSRVALDGALLDVADPGGAGRPKGKMITLVDGRREHYVEVDLGQRHS